MRRPRDGRVVFEKYQLGYYLIFHPETMAKILNTTVEELPLAVKEYVDNNPYLHESKKKPKSYMLGEYYFMNKELKVEYEAEICEDLELLILVLCSTVRDIYIPNRKLSFEKSKFNKVLFFPKEEVER